jgi:CRP-like cAMP-binding protein
VVADGTGTPIEVGIIGREGISAVGVVMGSERSHHEIFMQVPDTGRRIRAHILREAAERSLTLHRLLMRYAHSFLVQISQTALANGRSKTDERLARWLLLSHDRVDGDEVLMTHDFLSLMLGTPRPGVTVAVHQLAEEKLIAHGRGKITILDRSGLEAKCKGIYEAPAADE